MREFRAYPLLIGGQRHILPRVAYRWDLLTDGCHKKKDPKTSSALSAPLFVLVDSSSLTISNGLLVVGEGGLNLLTQRKKKGSVSFMLEAVSDVSNPAVWADGLSC